MEYPWNIHGISMEYLWIIYGFLFNTERIAFRLGNNPWKIPGLLLSLNAILSVLKISMEYPWNFHGMLPRVNASI